MEEPRAETRLAIVQRGFNICHYLFEPLPEGEWNGELDAKMWGRNGGLVCFFTAENGQKYRLTAFRIHPYSRRCPQGADRWYTARDQQIDFASPACQPGQKFRLVTGKNSRGRPVWLSAVRPAAGP